MEKSTGSLVEFRGRPWVVQKADSDDLIVLKPLGGTDAETIGLYRPLYENLVLPLYNFRKPSAEDVGKASYPSASRLLFNACRLSFRDIAGPFQCLGKLSFEPRPYQMVPLILALRQQVIRLLISDDVGIGKTLESLFIAKELLDRREISRFAVVCLPHLCEQWQNEIKDKFGLNAEIIRSSTISQIEKRLRPDQNVFRDIPFQVVSIDFVKQESRRRTFLSHCPDFIIVDEAHTCARPLGANKNQQQRYRLLRELADIPTKQLVLLTATPHSGHTEEFQSLIGLLKKEFETYKLDTPKEREELARHFVQRRRADIKQYLGGEVVFPNQFRMDQEEYSFSDEYSDMLQDLIEYVKQGIEKVRGEEKRKQRYIYWDLLALMRGVMSSPAAGISMLQNKIEKASNSSEAEEGIAEIQDTKIYTLNNPLKDLLDGDDNLPEAYETSSRSEKASLKSFVETLRHIQATDTDQKVKAALEMVQFALAYDKNPIVFCQYIQTAEYVGEYISRALSQDKKTKNVKVDTVTSRLADEERKLKIDELAAAEKHVLVCTDCLSEGVNLQQGFDAVIHYDLPWNPNRVEQRNGRVDRFGQISDSVLISTMHADNNPMDDIILNVLYKKQDAIKKKLGVYLPIADNDATLMESIMERILTSERARKEKTVQLSLFDDDKEFQEEQRRQQEAELQRIEENEKISRTYFAHNNKATSPERLTDTLNEARAVIGGVQDTCDFVVGELRHASVPVNEDAPLCYSFPLFNVPLTLRHYFKPDSKGTVRISFASPTPKRYMYIGRNHVFVEDLSRGVVNDTVNGGDLAACRAMVLQSAEVKRRTTVLLMRVRSVIRDVKNTDREIVGEEMIFVAYKGSIEEHDFLSQEEAKQLFLTIHASGDTSIAAQQMALERSIGWVNDDKALRRHTDDIALERAQHLVEAYSQYRTYLKGDEYQVVEPVLPMDVMAAYVFLPQIA